jgi:hypothetical protein
MLRIPRAFMNWRCGKLYLRDQDLLFCYDVKAGGK